MPFIEFRQNLKLLLTERQHELRILIKHFILHFTTSYWKLQFKMGRSPEEYRLEFGLKDHKWKIMAYPHYADLPFFHLYLLNLFTVTTGTSDESRWSLVKAPRKAWVQFVDRYKHWLWQYIPRRWRPSRRKKCRVNPPTLNPIVEVRRDAVAPVKVSAHQRCGTAWAASSNLEQRSQAHCCFPINQPGPRRIPRLESLPVSLCIHWAPETRPPQY